MKNLFIPCVLIASLSGCAVFRPATSAPAEPATASKMLWTNDPANTSQTVYHSDVDRKMPKHSVTGMKSNPAGGYSASQFRYAILTNTPVEQMTNDKLVRFMDEWYGTQYHYGGSTRDGIDCSAFAAQLQSDVYHIKDLPRMSRDQFSSFPHIKKNDLREGDLVFFHTLGRGHAVTHVGVYLYNGHFIHASVSGVMISDLSQGYYEQHYAGASRPE